MALASSPETWISLTNNILGDKQLRDEYQIWQVFYSTNMPILESRFKINVLLKQSFSQVQINSVYAHDAVIIGHSMGGVISRLLVSDVDVSHAAIPLMNYEQYIQYQQHPIIRERFIFKPELPFTRAIFIVLRIVGQAMQIVGILNSLKSLFSYPMYFLNKWISD